jgi:methanogenic corrinoid protein MtbC1
LFKKCNDIVEPALLATGADVKGALVVTATVKGDLHDLGKNMVGAMLKTAGFEVHDLGKDVPTEKIIDAVREMQPAIVGLSALLTTTVPNQKVVIEALGEAGLRDKVKVMVGGAPVTQEWADSIGADGFAPDAPEAVRIALELTAANAEA